MKRGLVIFDLNGLLIDSELLIWKSYRQVLLSRGIDFGREEFSEDWTRRGAGLSYTLKKHGVQHLDQEEIRREKEVIYHDLIRKELRLMPGVEDCITRLHGYFALAIDSTSKRVDVETALARFKLLDRFDFIDAKESGFAKKPAPDSLAHIYSSLKFSPTQTVLLDDAEKGIKAANAAGIHAIAVPNEYTSNNDFSGADLVLDSLAYLTLEIIQEVLSN